jgi:lincosamide nucleotidyltransferase A/C/D/E
MTADDVVEVLDRLDEISVEAWVDGGWAVDALLGEQTRPHADLDLLVRVADGPRLRSTLNRHGFDLVPGGTASNFVLRDAHGREIDLHLVRIDETGDGIYRMANGDDWRFPAGGFRGEGTIANRPVKCLTADVQMLCHSTGYEPGATDFHDMRLLHARLGTTLLPPYDAGSSSAVPP